MRSLTTVFFVLIAGCSSTSTPSTPGGSSSSSTTDDETPAPLPDPSTLSGTYVFQAADCSGTSVIFNGYKETVTFAGGKAKSVTETAKCSYGISDAPIRFVDSNTFEIVYSAGSLTCGPNPCTMNYQIVAGGQTYPSNPVSCQSGPVLTTGGSPPRFAARNDTLQVALSINGNVCTGQYIKL